MKHLILGRGRFVNMRSKLVIKPKSKLGGNVGHGGYVKKDLVPLEGQGIIKRKLQPLKFKM